MSSSPIPKLNPVEKLNSDFNFVEHHLEQMTAMFAILHGGLSEIQKSDNATEMKAIAEISLCEVQAIAKTIGGHTNA